MDIAALVLEYIKVLVWPGIVVAAILMFRTQLGAFIANIAAAVQRVQKVNAPGTSFELAEFVSELSDRVDAAVDTPKSEEAKQPPTADAPEDRLDDLAIGKIMRIWGEIEKSSRYLCELRAPKNGVLRYNFREQVRFLHSDGLITAEIADSLISAWKIRTQVAHGTWSLTLDTFDSYVRLITRLNAQLKLLSDGAL